MKHCGAGCSGIAHTVGKIVETELLAQLKVEFDELLDSVAAVSSSNRCLDDTHHGYRRRRKSLPPITNARHSDLKVSQLPLVESPPMLTSGVVVTSIPRAFEKHGTSGAGILVEMQANRPSHPGCPKSHLFVTLNHITGYMSSVLLIRFLEFDGSRTWNDFHALRDLAT